MGKIQRVITMILCCCIFVGCAENDSAVNIDKTTFKYFQESYEKCRDRFSSLSKDLQKKFNNVEEIVIPVPSRVGDDLTINCCYIPAQNNTEKLLIMSSGVHGVEGFAGSAVQQMFMNEIISSMDLTNIGVFLIHAMNPYGFKVVRRVTENNIDLNRNADIDKELFKTKNEGYSELNALLNPEKKVDISSFENRFFLIKAVIMIVKHSLSSLRQAIMQGQYDFEKGLYFGGSDSELQISAITPVLLEKTRDYKTVLAIDLHTGYGEKNRLHLFPNPAKNEKVRNAIYRIFDGYKIDWGDTEDFYTVNGDFSDFIGKIIPDKFYIPMTFEYGTMDSQTTTGSVKSIHIMILENQGFHYGYVSSDDEIEVKKRFREMYYPLSEEWRSEVIRQTREILPTALKRYQDL